MKKFIEFINKCQSYITGHDVTAFFGILIAVAGIVGIPFLFYFGEPVPAIFAIVAWIAAVMPFGFNCLNHLLGNDK